MTTTDTYLNRVGRDISRATNVSEALTFADLDFRVKLEPVFDADGIEIPRTFGAFRQDNRHCLGVNGSRYNVMQTTDAFSYIDEINKVHPLEFRRGGLLKGGKFFLSAQFDAFAPGGDDMEGIAIFISSFDGSFSNRVIRALKRGICLNVAIFGGSQFGIAAKHTEGASAKIGDFMDKFVRTAKNDEKVILAMQDSLITGNEVESLTRKLLGGRESKQAENTVAKIGELFTSGIGNSGRTAWDFFNAVSEYETHHFSRRTTEIASTDENAFDALIKGSSLTAKAYDLILDGNRLGLSLD